MFVPISMQANTLNTVLYHHHSASCPYQEFSLEWGFKKDNYYSISNNNNSRGWYCTVQWNGCFFTFTYFCYTNLYLYLLKIPISLHHKGAYKGTFKRKKQNNFNSLIQGQAFVEVNCYFVIKKSFLWHFETTFIMNLNELWVTIMFYWFFFVINLFILIPWYIYMALELWRYSMNILIASLWFWTKNGKNDENGLQKSQY